jgi:hypothetical protein
VGVYTDQSATNSFFIKTTALQSYLAKEGLHVSLGDIEKMVPSFRHYYRRQESTLCLGQLGLTVFREHLTKDAWLDVPEDGSLPPIEQ